MNDDQTEEPKNGSETASQTMAEEAKEPAAKKPARKKRKSTKEQIAELQSALSEMEDKHLRALAQLENFRKRSQRDVADARELSKCSTIEALLPILDHFQMAVDAANQGHDLATLKQGMDMIMVELSRCFEGLGVERIEAVGQGFDPNLHEAVSTEPSDEVPADCVLREWKAGYRLGDRLLRASTVVVSSGPEAPGEETAREAESEN